MFILVKNYETKFVIYIQIIINYIYFNINFINFDRCNIIIYNLNIYITENLYLENADIIYDLFCINIESLDT